MWCTVHASKNVFVARIKIINSKYIWSCAFYFVCYMHGWRLTLYDWFFPAHFNIAIISIFFEIIFIRVCFLFIGLLCVSVLFSLQLLVFYRSWYRCKCIYVCSECGCTNWNAIHWLSSKLNSSSRTAFQGHMNLYTRIQRCSNKRIINVLTLVNYDDRVKNQNIHIRIYYIYMEMFHSISAAH